MTKILHITWELSTGGIEALLISLYRHMDKDQVQFDILSCGDRGFLYGEELRQMGGHIYIVPKPPSLIEYSRRLAAFFEEHHDYAAIHLHLPWFGWMFIKQAKRFGIEKRYVHFHNGMETAKKALYRKLERAAMRVVDKRLMQASDCVFVASRKVAQYHRTQQLGKGNAYFLKNGVEGDRFQFQPEVRAIMRKELKVEGKYVLVCPARLVPIKHHMFLIDIVEEMRQRGENVALLLAGTGPLEEELRAKVRRLGLDEYVQFLGARGDVDRLMQAADAFVLPSGSEGLAVSYIEAQAAGLRVYTAEEALAEEAVITDLIATKPLSASAASWAEWIMQGKEYPRQGRLAELVKTGFNIEETAHRLQQLYLGEKTVEELFERV